jgi:hypothetical protein
LVGSAPRVERVFDDAVRDFGRRGPRRYRSCVSSTTRSVEAAKNSSRVDAPSDAAEVGVAADGVVQHGGSRRFLWWAIAAGVALFLIHLVQGAQLRVPVTYYDEGGYLGNARYLVSGYGRSGGDYYAGYSVLLTPAAAITDAATTFFHGALITNAVLAVATAGLALVLSRQVVPDGPRWVAFVAAATVAVCPFVFTFAGMAMSENALIPATLLAAVLLGSSARTGSWKPRIGVVLVTAYAYWVTPRGIIVAGAGLLALLVLTLEQQRRWRELAAEAALMAVVLVGEQLFENAIRGASDVHGVTDRTHGLFTAVFQPGDWRMWLACVFGRFAYLGIASAGFFLIGIVVGASWLAPRVRRSPSDLARVRRSVSAFALVAVGVTIASDAMAVAGIPAIGRLDFVYYGRYAEAVALPTVVIGVSWTLTTLLSRRAGGTRRAFVGAAAVGGSIAVMAMLARVLATSRPPDATVNPVSVLALFPYLRSLIPLGIDPPGVTKALLVGAAVTGVTLVLVAWRVRWFAVLPIVLLAILSGVVHERLLERGSQFHATQDAIATAIEILDANGVSTSCVDSAPPISSFWFFGNYQFLLPQTNFVLPGEPPDPTCPLVLTSDVNRAVSHPNDRLVAMENHEPLLLWLRTETLSEDLRDRLEREGLFNPGPVCAPFPDDGYRATIEARPDGALTAATDLRRIGVDLVIEHTGAGAPWLGTYALTDAAGCGRVQVGISVENEQGETVAERVVPTPSVLFPGASWRLHVPIADGPTEPELAPGLRYRLRVRLIHTGIRDFGGTDGRGVTVPLGST